MKNRLTQYFTELASKQSPGALHYQGLIAGYKWAAHSATLLEIECLEIFRDHLQATGQWNAWFIRPDELTVADRWHFAVIDPRGTNIRNRLPINPNRVRSQRFWKAENVSDEQRASDDFVKGFTDGALRKWREFMR